MNPTTALLLCDRQLPRHHRTGRVSVHVDAGAQARSLLEFDQAPISLGLYPLVRDHHHRIILTGTGASHIAALPSWRRLVAARQGRVVGRHGNLLENPQVATSDSLLVVTSRSGSGRYVRALIDGLGRAMRPAAAIAITDDPASPPPRLLTAKFCCVAGHRAARKDF